MKRVLFYSLLVLGSFGNLCQAANYEIDPAHSMVIFKINHLGVSNTYGRINEPKGHFVFDEKKPEDLKVEIEMDVQKLDTFNQKRDEHLKGPDFFNSAQFAKITFKSKSAKKKGAHQYQVQGDLTLKGVTKPMTLTVTHVGTGKDPWGGTRSGFDTEFEIKRSDFGMNFMLPKKEAPGVGDSVKLLVSVEGILKP